MSKNKAMFTKLVAIPLPIIRREK